MLRSLQAFLVLGVWAVSAPAAAQDFTDESSEESSDEPLDEPSGEPADPPADDDTQTDSDTGAVAAPEPTDEPTSGTAPADEPPSLEPVKKSVEQPTGWQTEIHGYFRAPAAMGFSPRPNPETHDATTNTFTGPEHLQVSYGPTRTIDANYYSFAYTRLQEQDWAEVTIHAKKKHVDAAVGWMGYWYQGAGFRNPDAAWAPGLAYLTLDTDVAAGGLEPNIALTAGAFWPAFGTFEQYDTYTLGRFRQVGEQLKLTTPVTPDLTVTLVQGFGTSRDGSFHIDFPAPYQGNVGLDLLHYENVRITYDDYLDVGLHYNNEWSRDPFLWPSGSAGKNYNDVRHAHLTTVGGEVTLRAPYAGKLWVSPSIVTVRNGWALDWAGTEVMHSIGGMGIAANYMAFTNNPPDSTGSGSMRNVGFSYENTLSNIQGEKPATSAPEVTFEAFGLFSDISLDLPEGSTIPQHKIGQFKYGADVEYQALDWLGLMLRFDEVNYNLDHGGYVFSAISPRLTVSSHFLSSESIYIQYSRYRYGDNMTLVGTWPWGTPLVPGSDLVQGSPYTGQKPDMDVLRIQATVAF